MRSCWEEIPDVRPPFSELVSDISALLGTLAEYVDFNSTNTATKLPEPAPSAGFLVLGVESETAGSLCAGDLGGDADDDAIAELERGKPSKCLRRQDGVTGDDEGCLNDVMYIPEMTLN